MLNGNQVVRRLREQTPQAIVFATTEIRLGLMSNLSVQMMALGRFEVLSLAAGCQRVERSRLDV